LSDNDITTKRYGVVTIFPEMFNAITQYGVTSRAVNQGYMALETWNPRSYTQDRHQTVDDRPYGGGPGMVMSVQPLKDAISDAKKWAGSDAKVIYLSPQGKPLTQAAACELAQEPGLVFLAGRYEGVDERLIEAEIDQEWSIGDYVLSGGELGAMVMIDSISRLIPGVLGHNLSAEQDSFSDGLLDCPHYTRPEVYEGKAVPNVLLSGNHEHIRQWRLKQSLARTYERRPDLLQRLELDNEQQRLLDEYLTERAKK